MKKLSFLLIVAVLLVSSSCKKTTTDIHSGVLKFSVGGTNYSYNSTGGVVANNINGSNTTAIGAADPSNSINNITISLAGTTSGIYSCGTTATVTWNDGTASKLYGNLQGLYNGGNFVLNVSGSTATATFNTEIYNAQNPADSLMITGTYSGGFSTL